MVLGVPRTKEDALEALEREKRDRICILIAKELCEEGWFSQLSTSYDVKK